ncbi:MAG: hypothetical protein HY708_02920 [Ignavibacteriae bacterium]|nr:hypothetical protein [Ignavibacteriota bacterium]
MFVIQKVLETFGATYPKHIQELAVDFRSAQPYIEKSLLKVNPGIRQNVGMMSRDGGMNSWDADMSIRGRRFLCVKGYEIVSLSALKINIFSLS